MRMTKIIQEFRTLCAATKPRVGRDNQAVTHSRPAS